jgi:LysM repeat protein
MTRRQIALIIIVNALISTLISVAVVLLLGRPDLVALPIGTAPPGTAASGSTSSVDEPTAIAQVTSTPVVHVVQSGDTISALALLYDVPAADIIAANGLENPNVLRIGMELTIPLGGVPVVTATFTPAPTGTDTPIPFEPPSADLTATALARAGATATLLPTPVPESDELEVVIAQVMSPGDIAQEGVLIMNVGEGLADLQGWTLSDTSGSVYTFPSVRLWAEGALTVHSRVGTDDPPADFYWGKLQAIWSAAEVATLKDAEGNVINTYVVVQ